MVQQSTAQFHEKAKRLDAEDSLAYVRDEFGDVLDEIIYLDGNSLGPLPRQTKKLLTQTIDEEWGVGMIESWNAVWFELPTRLGAKLAPLIGAKFNEVCFADSVTINFIKLATAALRHQKGRTGVITDSLNFPSNLYALAGLQEVNTGALNVKVINSDDNERLSVDDYTSQITEQTALVTLSHVVFKSGFKQDLEAIVKVAHSKGALVLADISHAVGAVDIQLNKWDVDLAVGCSYKYLNGGPGSTAFLYVREDLISKLSSPLQGWLGAQNPFAFDQTYQPAEGIRRFLMGTPPVLSLRAIEPGLDIMNQVGMPAIVEKSQRLIDFFLEMVEVILVPLGFKLASPTDKKHRGSHISLSHAEALKITKALINPQVDAPSIIPDFRAPNYLRIAFTPLYLKFDDIYRTIVRISEIINTKEYETVKPGNETVT